MKTEEQMRAEMRETPEGRLLVRYGFEPYDTESAARIVARKAAKDFTKILVALQAASNHLDYCGYGDSWERQGAEKLPAQIAEALSLKSQLGV